MWPQFTEQSLVCNQDRVDELKIDRAFVNDIVPDASSRAIAESIILLGRVLGLSVIAGEVEKAEQRDAAHFREAVQPGIACKGVSVLEPGGLIEHDFLGFLPTPES